MKNCSLTFIFYCTFLFVSSPYHVKRCFYDVVIFFFKPWCLISVSACSTTACEGVYSWLVRRWSPFVIVSSFLFFLLSVTCPFWLLPLLIHQIACRSSYCEGNYSCKMLSIKKLQERTWMYPSFFFTKKGHWHVTGFSVCYIEFHF